MKGLGKGVEMLDAPSGGRAMSGNFSAWGQDLSWAWF